MTICTIDVHARDVVAKLIQQKVANAQARDVVVKSKILRSLNKTYANLKRKPMWVDINPKAVTTLELFGFINPATREWKDGKCLPRPLLLLLLQRIKELHLALEGQGW